MNTSCGKEWTRKQLIQAFNKSFVNKEWKQVRMKVLFDKEVALLPATQALVEEEIQKEIDDKNKKRKIKEYLNKIKDVSHKINDMRYNQLPYLNAFYSTDKAQIQQLKKEIKLFSQYRKKLSEEYRIYRYRTFPNQVTVNKEYHFVRSCPDENCRGFLDNQWKCGICKQYSCSECHVVKGEDCDCNHECNPDDVATAKLLASDTKPCPKCATGIFKIDGCDQMWCTQCKTAFSWRTGAIETKIHNPHYYEWQRQMNGGVAPRNPDDVVAVCGEEVLDHRMFRNITDLLYAKSKSYVPLNPNNSDLNPIENEFCYKLSQVIRATIHLQLTTLDTYRVNQVEDNVKLRISYMRNKISKSHFQERIQQANKSYDKKRETYDILQLFIQVITSIINRVKTELIRYDGDNLEPAIRILNESDAIAQYTNAYLADIVHTYNTSGGIPLVIKFT
jgi:hypothetical protein